jgi:replicative DNA helicase
MNLPSHIEAERILLGAMILDEYDIGRVTDCGLDKDRFFLRKHQLIFEGIMELVEKGYSLDTVALSEVLRGLGSLEEVGGFDYLDDLISGIPAVVNIPHYAGIINEKYTLRRLHDIGKQMEAKALDCKEGSLRILNEAENEMFKLREGRDQIGFVPLGKAAEEAMQRIEEHAKNKNNLIGLDTGFADLNRITGGLHSGDLIIVAARPAMGKTAFCLNLALNAATRVQAKVALFSLEMPATQLSMRMISSESDIDVSRLRKGELESFEWDKAAHAMGRLAEVPIFIEDSGVATIPSIRSKLKQLARQEDGIDLVVIDYLQLMSGATTAEKQNRVQEISGISRGLKLMAKEFNVPIIALSQLSRAAEQRSDHRPQLADLRESGSIEQDADMVCFLFRQDYYDEMKRKEEGVTMEPENQSDMCVAELIIAKHRNGATGNIELAFIKRLTKFVSFGHQLPN